MALVVQIVLLLLLLVALIGTFMSIKNWHWAQMLLLLGILLFGAASLLLTAETLRTHRALRQNLAGRQEDLARVQAENAALVRGTRDEALINRLFPEQVPFNQEAEGQMPGLAVWSHRLQILSRERGRAWARVQRSSNVDPSGKVEVQIPPTDANAQHSLEKDSTVYAFEEGPPSGAEPPQGAQYLGEFRVLEKSPEGAVLQSLQQLDQRTGQRLQQSQRTWRLYETMPADDHALFAGLDEATLRQLLPAATVQEYLRHGSPMQPDDDPANGAWYDEQGRRIGPDDASAEAEGRQQRYDRQLRDYGYLLAELARQRVLLNAEGAALVEDNKKLQAAQESAARLTVYREGEKQSLEADLQKMTADRQAIERHRDQVLVQLNNARELFARAVRENQELAQALSNRQLAQVEAIDATAPRPAAAF